MRDDQLRDGMAAWLGPAQQAPAPDVGVIRRRLRRRRARQAAAGTVVCALAAAGALTLAQGGAATPATNTGPGPRPGVHAPCRAGQLRVAPAAVLVRSTAIGMEKLPDTYLLRIENSGRAACSLTGWPRLSIAAPRAMRAVPVSYGTLLSRATRHGSATRVLEPARVVLAPGSKAAAMVTVTYSLSGAGCQFGAAWSVTPPGGSPAVVRHVQASGPHGGLEICRTSAVTVSPVYPAAVPVTQNYPRSAPAELPASLVGSLPAAGAGPGTAPYFMVLRQPDVVVYDWQTGRVTAVIRPPRGAPQEGFTGVAAAGDDRTFVLAAGDHFYEAALGQRGTLAGPLARLPVPPTGDSGEPFAVSPDASELALALPQPGEVATDEIMVVSLTDGATHVWRSPDPGSVYGLSWEDPLALRGEAWSGHPRLLFDWVDTTPADRAARLRSGLWLLDPGAGGTSLVGSRLLVSASVRVGTLRGLNYPLINAAGTVVFATMVEYPGAAAQAAVVAFSTATGHPLGVVTPLADESGMGTWCGALWADPAGSHALAACRAQGEISGTVFTRLSLHFPAPNFGAGPNFFAW